MAASEAMAALHLGVDGPRFAGSIALGRGGPAFTLGVVAGRGRVPGVLRLCDAVSGVMEALGEGCAAAVEPGTGGIAAPAPATSALPIDPS